MECAIESIIETIRRGKIIVPVIAGGGCGARVVAEAILALGQVVAGHGGMLEGAFITLGTWALLPMDASLVGMRELALVATLA